MLNQQRKMSILFDRSTGRILGTHAVYDAAIRDYRMPTSEEARAAFHRLLEGRTSDQVDMMEAEFPTLSAQGHSYVDVAQRQLVPKARLGVQAARTQIQGDGQDSVLIEISVVDESNQVIESFNEDLRVSTGRGRLSAPGGRIKAEKGRASITLTSTIETVEQVLVSVRDPLERCMAGSLSVEFL